MSYPQYGPEGHQYPAPAGPAPAPAYPAPPPSPAGLPITTLVLGVVCLLLLVLAGLGLGLYVNERRQHNATEASLRDRDTTITETESRADDLEARLNNTEDQLSDMTKERDALLPCMRRAQEIFDALRRDDDDDLGTALEMGITSCAEAEEAVDK
ncbi:uncharacterized protein HemX [Catenuloplanes nepalensis]|uniref:Uncharacterized protein HemX n=1 Tax=Catenuloplanes nepalensis TaxID=587533 RepID=A0ABT9MN88_9ACTN|nr:hypothetical protein [Catenuloplanes nepalensis]MDP9792867.1 uncharacterized protein HemX [Catenuloplanes nepalensis]